jgi:hypothetical protein
VAIPAIPELDRFLSSISLDTVGSLDGRHAFEVIRPKTHFDGNRYVHTPAIEASCVPGKITFEAVLKTLGNEVRKVNHLANDAMLRLLLVVAAASRPADRSAVAHFNFLLDRICECDCSSFLIARIDDQRATRKRIGNFQIGEVDTEKIRYRCKRVGCDFFERYLDAFQNCYGLERDPSKIRVIDFSALPTPRVARSTMEAMRNEYFDLISLNMFTRFVQEFEEGTLLANALGAPILDLRSLLGADGSFVSIFWKVGRDGFGHFRPIGARSLMVFQPPEDQIIQTQSALREQFLFSEFDRSELHQVLKNFSRLVFRARQLREKGDEQEAFLGCIIALESIFGDRDVLTRSLVSRLAVVAAGPLEKTVGEVAKLISKIYGSRSKYVHSGIEVPENDLESVWPIVGAAMEALLRLQANSANRHQISIEGWLRKLDHFYVSVLANEAVPVAKFIENGLIPPPID